MIAIIRIKGHVKIKIDMEETLQRLRLGKKFSCVVVRETEEIMGMVKKIENFVAFGKIDKETLKELIEKRGQSKKKKIDAGKIAEEYLDGKTEKSLEELGVRNFFRLHPPRGGIETKVRYPKGVLGNHGDKINELVRRML